MATYARIVLCCDSFMKTNSGIARVARLMGRTVFEELETSCQSINGLSLENVPYDLPFPVTSVNRSQLHFLARTFLSQFQSTHFLYDTSGIARAHGWNVFSKRPYLVWMNGIEIWPETTNAAKKRVAVRANQRVAITQFSRNRAAEVDPILANSPICWLATETDEMPSIIRYEGPPRVLIFSRVDKGSYKGHRELIECWPKIRSKVPDAILTIAGKGPGLEDFQRLAAQTGLPDSAFEFPGFIPEDQVEALWRQTSVFAMPSRGEGFGLVYIEAMRYGVPVIASVHDAGSEVNAEGESGFNVNLDKVDELPERLITLLQDRDLASLIGASGQQRWKTHFTFSAFRSRFAPILREFLKT